MSLPNRLNQGRRRGIVCLMALVILMIAMNLALAQFGFSFLLQKRAQAIPEGLDRAQFQKNGPILAMEALLADGSTVIEGHGTTWTYSGDWECGDCLGFSVVSVHPSERPQWGEPCRLRVVWLSAISASTSSQTAPQDVIDIWGCERAWETATDR